MYDKNIFSYSAHVRKILFTIRLWVDKGIPGPEKPPCPIVRKIVENLLLVLIFGMDPENGIMVVELFLQ